MRFSSDRLVPAIAFCIASSSLVAAEIPLVAASPFFPGSTPINVSVLTEGAPIELQGVESVGGELRFSIYTPETQKAQWVGLNESGFPYVVRSHDVVDGSDQIKVDYFGTTLTLGLKAPQVASTTGNGRGVRTAVTVQGAAPVNQNFQGGGAAQGARGGPGAGGRGRGGRGGGANGNGGQASTIAPDQAASILAAAAAARNSRAVANQQAAQTVDQAAQRARGRAARGGQ